MVGGATSVAVLLLLLECLLAGLGFGVKIKGQGLAGVNVKRSYNVSESDASCAVTEGRGSQAATREVRNLSGRDIRLLSVD